jgi:hypothetical protein
MRIRKRNRILRRVVLGFALVALVVPAGRAKAAPDAGRSYTPTKSEYSVQLADPKFGQSVEGNGLVQLADPKFGQSVDRSVQIADPKFGQSDEPAYIAFGDYPQPVELGTYGMPAAGRNVYLETHNGKALVERENVSTPQVIVSSGFDWSDAGIGAGILAGLMIVLGGAALAARELGRPQTA